AFIRGRLLSLAVRCLVPAAVEALTKATEFRRGVRVARSAFRVRLIGKPVVVSRFAPSGSIRLISRLIRVRNLSFRMATLRRSSLDIYDIGVTTVSVQHGETG